MVDTHMGQMVAFFGYSFKESVKQILLSYRQQLYHLHTYAYIIVDSIVSSKLYLYNSQYNNHRNHCKIPYFTWFIKVVVFIDVKHCRPVPASESCSKIAENVHVKELIFWDCLYWSAYWFLSNFVEECKCERKSWQQCLQFWWQKCLCFLSILIRLCRDPLNLNR